MKINKNISKFQVPMHHIHLIDRLEPFNNLTQKESSFLFVESASYFSQMLKVTTIAVLHEQVKVVNCFLDII